MGLKCELARDPSHKERQTPEGIEGPLAGGPQGGESTAPCSTVRRP